MDLFELEVNLDPKVFTSNGFLQGSILFFDQVYGTLKLKSATGQNALTLASIPNISNKVLNCQNAPNRSAKKIAGGSVKRFKAENMSEVRESNQAVTTNQISPSANVSASDVIKTMQDFETKKKMFYCICCKYESSHHGTIKRHVEAKHLPKSVTYNCLQCPKTFNVKSGLKCHYMKFHGLVEPAAKAMLPV